MYFQMKATDNEVAEIHIDGEIVSEKLWDSDVSATDFRDSLKELGPVKTINMSINSPGGSVFDGIAIYNMLKKNPATVNVTVEGLAASIASVIAMAGDTLTMDTGSMLMIHNPFTMAVGNASELREMADTLDQIRESSVNIYHEKTGIDKEAIKSVMDNETWLTADEAITAGWADQKNERPAVMQSISQRYSDMYEHVPEFLNAQEKPDKEQSEGMSMEERKQRAEAIQDYIDSAEAYLKEIK
ncbi:head maturation protease, ClpP-related [Weissella paramesenteroides]|uniref:ATP-dependent Clp protease proteolytic subunit n=1 Tax=Weissella paramesenteroides ATCC 33313 TaxID=585506 RepID=C5R880_WEIPA|nr:head maturation protease, ClpP-related [Weissella paramesenteroides]EER75664.1 endopeptidase Clp [Weissella paramesenteroides ATCC 33313]